MKDTVLTDTDIAKAMDRAARVQDQRIFPVRLARAIESAVLQSPEVVAMREAATQDAINYAKSFDRGHVAGWDSALEAAIDIVAIHGGSVEIEAAIRAIKSPDADMKAKP